MIVYWSTSKRVIVNSCVNFYSERLSVTGCVGLSSLHRLSLRPIGKHGSVESNLLGGQEFEDQVER